MYFLHVRSRCKITHVRIPNTRSSWWGNAGPITRRKAADIFSRALLIFNVFLIDSDDLAAVDFSSLAL